MADKHTTTVLIILDGFGIADPKQKGNPITPETMPHYFSWLKKFPHTELAASGEAVGLFKGQEGNSEAGHLNIGAGRVVKQDALYISEAIADGTFSKNNAFLQGIRHAEKYGTAVHIMGLLSNHSSAHSTPEHVYALLDLCAEFHIKKVFLHLFTDGRDSGQHDAPGFLKKLETHFHGNEKVATMMGRFYAMDRNKVWERTKAAYEALTQGKGRAVESAQEALTMAYNSKETDEFISPSVIVEKGKPVGTIKDNDVVFFFNLRSDRARELTKAFVQPHFEKENQESFHRKRVLKNIRFIAMTDFGPDLPHILTAFPSRDVPNSLPQVLCPRRQLYIAESEKFAHITYFLNGGYAQHFCDEQWVKIESNHAKDFGTVPAMKAAEIANYVTRALEQARYDFIAINFANADMIGHTGELAAGREAAAALDQALNTIVGVLSKTNARGIITADHGNAEEMINLKTGEVDTEHSTNPVPCVILAAPEELKQWKVSARTKLRKGKLADVAPTILKMMGITKPSDMTGKSLI